MQAVIEQVRHDHALLKERVARLGGPKATARLEAGLAAARAAALAQASASTTPSVSPNSSPAKSPSSSSSLPASPEAVANSPTAGGAVAGEVDENEGMAWELLYNLKWQLPTEELEAGWKDATGETSVMKVQFSAHLNTLFFPRCAHDMRFVALSDPDPCCISCMRGH